MTELFKFLTFILLSQTDFPVAPEMELWDVWKASLIRMKLSLRFLLIRQPQRKSRLSCLAIG